MQCLAAASRSFDQQKVFPLLLQMALVFLKCKYLDSTSTCNKRFIFVRHFNIPVYMYVAYVNSLQRVWPRVVKFSMQGVMVCIHRIQRNNQEFAIYLAFIKYYFHFVYRNYQYWKNILRYIIVGLDIAINRYLDNITHPYWQCSHFCVWIHQYSILKIGIVWFLRSPAYEFLCQN
jgi:hypothetical protein